MPSSESIPSSNQTSSTQANSPQPPKLDLSEGMLFIILGVIGLLTPFAIDMYLPAMPTIAKDFMVDGSIVQLTLTAYTGGFAIGQLLHGPLADSYGRKPILLIGIISFTITSIVCAMTTSIDALIVMRFVQGFMGAAAAVIVQAIVRDIFDREDFARAMSFITLVITISPLLAPLVGGYVSLLLGWRFIFGALAAVSLMVLVTVFFKIPETLASENKRPFRIVSTLRNYVRLLMNLKVFGLMLSSAFSFGSMFAFISASSFVYIDIFGIPKSQYAYYFAINVIGMIFMTRFNGLLVRRKGSHWMLRFGLNFQLIGALCLLISWYFDFGLWGIIPSIALIFGTVSVIGSNSMALLLSSYPGMAGTASSLAGTMRFGMGALASAVVAMMPSGYVWPMVVTMSGSALLAFIFYWALSRDV